jgi:hypothetical protein
VAEHWKLQRVLGCEGDPPSKWAAYRFAAKLRENGDKLERCIDTVVEGLRSKVPDYGTNLAIDASDLPAYANGQPTSPRAGRNGSATAIPTRHGVTALRFQSARAAATTATAFTLPPARRRGCRSRGT